MTKFIDGEWVTLTDLIEKHERFIRARSKRYWNKGIAAGMDKDDLYACACIGIMKAFDQFDPGRGFKFLTYAGTKIDGTIQQEIKRNTRLIHIPAHIYELVGRIIRNGLENETPQAIAEKLEVRPQEAKRALELDPYTLSYDAETNENTEKIYFLQDKSPSFDGWEFEFVDHLSGREKEVMALRLQGKTLQEIGDTLGFSRQNAQRYMLKIAERWEAYENGNQCAAY